MTTPDQLIEAVVVIIEQSAPRRYATRTAALDPLTAEEIDTVADRVSLLCAKIKPRTETT